MRLILLAASLTTLLAASPAYAASIVSHQGDTDPTTEGFTQFGVGLGGTQVGALSPDPGYGVNAWKIEDNSYSVPSARHYDYSLTGADQAAAATFGYQLDVGLRVVDITNGLGDTADHAVSLLFRSGTHSWSFLWGTESNADPVLRLNGSLVAGLSGSGYHDYRFEIAPGASSGDLYFDGGLVAANVAGVADTNPALLSWGARSSPFVGQGHWSEVSLNAVPEPGSALLLALGACALVGRRRRR